MCLGVRERTRACLGAHACVREGAGSRTCGCACVRLGGCYYACMIYQI